MRIAVFNKMMSTLQDLETWVREAGEDGFIYMSLGTAVTPSDMPEEYVEYNLHSDNWNRRKYFTTSKTIIMTKK